MTERLKEILDKLNEIAARDENQQAGHAEADDLLLDTIELLAENGSSALREMISQIVDTFTRIDKWYLRP